MVINVSNANTCLFFLDSPFGPEIQRGSHPLTWSSHIIPWSWRVDFLLLHKIRLQKNIQGDVLLAILGFPVFPNIVPSTTCHVYRCELLVPGRLLVGSTMINSWWCVVLQLLGTSCSCYNNNCITKLWAHDPTFSIYKCFYWHCFHTVYRTVSVYF